MGQQVGRPPAERESGSGEKLRAYFEITHRPWTDLTKESKRREHETSVSLRTLKQLPSLKALKGWAELGIPTTKIPVIAEVANIPASYFYSHESFEMFRRYVLNQTSGRSAMVPMRDPTTNGHMIDGLTVMVQYNDNIKLTLQIIIRSNADVTIDDIADEIGISTIQLREILAGLMEGNVVEVANDKAGSSQSGPARLRLTAMADANRALIEGIIHAPAE